MNYQITDQIIDYVISTNYKDLPDDVKHESKRLIYDTLCCMIVGTKLDVGKILLKFAKDMEGSKHSTTIGGYMNSCPIAALINGQLGNASDLDEVFYNFTHFGTSIVATSLAVGEYAGSSGREIINAIALGYDVAARIGMAFPRLAYIEGEPPDLEYKKGNRTANYIWQVFGCVAAAGKLLKLNNEKLKNALGIAGFNVSLPARTRFGVIPRVPMTRYACLGWIAHTGTIATMLANRGFTGDRYILDGENGFWKIVGADDFYADIAIDGIRDKWWIRDIAYKLYPCCRGTHHILDALYSIIFEKKLSSDDIEKIVVGLHPRFYGYLDRKNPSNPLGFQFYAPYILAAASLGIEPSKWQTKEVLNSKNLEDFSKKINVFMDKKALEIMYKEVGNKPRAFKKCGSSIEVYTKDKVFKDYRVYAKGDSWIKDTKLKDEDLIKKFNVFTKEMISQKQRNTITTNIFNLENISDIKTLMNVFHD